MAVVGVFAFNFTVTLPLLAKFTFDGGAGLYSWFMVAMGAGAVARRTGHRVPQPALDAAARLHRGRLRRRHPGRRALARPQVWALVLLVPMGAASISFVATNNATLQLRADPSMRGRVMSLNAIAFLGQHADRCAAARLHQRRHQPPASPSPSAAWRRCWPASRSSCSGPASAGAAPRAWMAAAMAVADDVGATPAAPRSSGAGAERRAAPHQLTVAPAAQAGWTSSWATGA